MAPWNPKSPLLPSLLARVLARVRASSWPPLVLRASAIVVALFVLAWIGKTAAAGPSAPSQGASDADAGGLVGLVATPPPFDAGAASATPPSPAAAPEPVAGAAPHGRASTAEPVFINRASVDELRRLPGVGPKRAEAILVLRQRLGRFQRVEDLLRVKGVGRGAVKKWRPLVRLDTPSAEPDGSGTDGGSR